MRWKHVDLADVSLGCILRILLWLQFGAALCLDRREGAVISLEHELFLLVFMLGGDLFLFDQGCGYFDLNLQRLVYLPIKRSDFPRRLPSKG